MLPKIKLEISSTRPPPPERVLESPEELIRKLVRRVEQEVNLQDNEGSTQLFRLVLDGSQYALFRWPVDDNHHLSPRETEIVRLVAQGLPNKCISEVLEISSWTVATHLRRIYAKLGVNSRAAMVNKLSELHLRNT
jgi:DNA-binding CsgD family transcriptional regulator